MIQTKFIAISAMSADGVIGIDDNIPWRIPEDMKHFRDTTINHTLIVGYKTYLTLPKAAFNYRTYLVLNSDLEEEIYFQNDSDREVIQFNNIFTLLKFIKDIEFEIVYVIGGESIYNLFIDYCDEAIITWVDKTYPDGNKKFPIEKLYSDFKSYHSTNWLQSKNKEYSYNITKYYRLKDCVNGC